MKIRVKYFSALRDITGKISEELEMPDGSTLGDLINWFFKQYPKAQAFKEELLVLVNGKSLDWSYVLSGGDEVAIMPPVSGGGGVINAQLDLNKELADSLHTTAPQGA
ncbi:MAG: MoaD/ThiS family protein, partial [Pyrobaculum sp.]